MRRKEDLSYKGEKREQAVRGSKYDETDKNSR
jgi:hypothetical protein